MKKGYQRALLESGLNCDTKYLGVGSAKTWHGSTEVRIEGCNVISTEENLLEDQSEYVNSDDGGDDKGADYQEENIDGTSHLSASQETPESSTAAHSVP